MDKGKDVVREPASQSPRIDGFMVGACTATLYTKGKDIAREPASQGPQIDGFMVQDPIIVDISRNSILRQIISKVGATIRTEGIAKLDSARRVAWLTVEVLRNEGAKGPMEVESFQSIPCMTDFEARENVSELVINHYMLRMNINVNDINYASAVEAYRQMNHCMCWSQILQIRYETLRIEKDKIANAHMDLLKRLSSVCGRYSDILPLAPGGLTMHPPSVCIEPVVYIGAMPPETRHEQLAGELFHILQESAYNGNLIVDSMGCLRSKQVG